MSIPPPASRVQRVRFEIKRRELEVVRVATPTPGFRSVTFGGETLADFASASFDDHVKFMLDGDAGEPVRRDYTPRSFDVARRELTIEFSLHSDGPAAKWAAQAEPGQRATVGGPRGSMIIPADYAWHLLAGDETALPAIARRLEELPADAKIIVIGQVSDLRDRRAFTCAAPVDFRWVARDDELLDAVRLLELPPGAGYAWCAGEAASVGAVRKVLVDEKGLDRHPIRAAAYWKRGVAAHHENLDG